MAVSATAARAEDFTVFVVNAVVVVVDGVSTVIIGSGIAHARHCRCLFVALPDIGQKRKRSGYKMR